MHKHLYIRKCKQREVEEAEDIKKSLKIVLTHAGRRDGDS
jgi:hypothetical protein